MSFLSAHRVTEYDKEILPRPQPQARDITHAVPHTIRHLGRQLMALELLIDQPHAHHELLSAQQPDSLPIHQIPHLLERGKRQAAAAPDLAYDQVQHHVRFVAHDRRNE